MPVYFYGTNGEYGCFSNFAAYPIRLHGKQWPTNEHYFQAQKFAGTEHEETVRRAETPAKAKRIGNDRRLPLRSDWDRVKDAVMYEAVLAKFTQCPELRRLLLDTGDDYIAEHTERDHYWGDGGDGSGKNRLGLILMEVRKELGESPMPP
ncbi:MAG: NADAR family protein [Kiritimatiellae bacterium]|nr:NADAR family protein [Kiritimatiellia bacterium]